MTGKAGGYLRTFRDSAMAWPMLRVSVQLLPWNWSLRWYYESTPRQEGHAGWWGFDLYLGPLAIEYGHNRPAFTWERPEVCRTAEVDGEPVVVRGSGDMTQADCEALTAVVRAAKAQFGEQSDPEAPS